MKIEFEIGQDVWIIGANEPIHVLVKEINVSEKKVISYSFKTFSGISLSSNLKEEFVGSSKEELRDKLFK